MHPLLALLPSILIAYLGFFITMAGSQDRLPRNHIVGIRLPATTRSDRAWSAAHRAATPYNIGAGTCFLLAGLAAAFLAGSDDARTTILFAGWAIAFVWVAIAVVVAVRAAKAADPTEPGGSDTAAPNET